MPFFFRLVLILIIIICKNYAVFMEILDERRGQRYDARFET
jgi:hypothetical protein